MDIGDISEENLCSVQKKMLKRAYDKIEEFRVFTEEQKQKLLENPTYSEHPKRLKRAFDRLDKTLDDCKVDILDSVKKSIDLVDKSRKENDQPFIPG